MPNAGRVAPKDASKDASKDAHKGTPGDAGKAGGKKAQTTQQASTEEKHVSVNGFNAVEVKDMLASGAAQVATYRMSDGGGKANSPNVKGESA